MDRGLVNVNPEMTLDQRMIKLELRETKENLKFLKPAQLKWLHTGQREDFQTRRSR
jgi:hypothetical protein